MRCGFPSLLFFFLLFSSLFLSFFMSCDFALPTLVACIGSAHKAYVHAITAYLHRFIIASVMQPTQSRPKPDQGDDEVWLCPACASGVHACALCGKEGRLGLEVDKVCAL